MKKRYFFIFIIVIIGICALTLTACMQNENSADGNTVYGLNKFSAKYLGETPRILPEVTDGGLDRYPQYNKLLANATAAEKEAILAENKELFNYDKIDKDGNLYKNGESLNKKLSKHSASQGLYGGDLSDSAKSCAKRIRITPHNLGNNMTGLYAAPGEIVTVILNQDDAKRNMFVDIGQCNARQGGNNIPVNKDFTRMPMLKNALKLTETENYIGSPLGGPIYIRNEGGSLEPFEVTIIGAIEMPHYLHAYTTDAEWEQLRQAPAPLFDMEVYPGIRLSMPSFVIRNKTARQMRDISEFWYKAMCLSNKVSNGAWFKDHPVTMIYDTYIPAGAAVAFVGADCCMLPIDWAKSSMNYDTIYKSGAWGSLHEFNHHHQGWGADAGGEVTNNVINALTYMLYTDVAALRTEDGGLTGWNWVSDSYATLKKVLNSSADGKANTTLSMYVTLAQAFGSDAVINMANNSTAKTHTAWYKAAVKATGYDMTYYLRDLCNLTIDESAINEVKAQNLPTFVPIASLYQSGIINSVTGEPVIMGRPFTIPFGKEKELDFAKNIACPNNYSYQILGIDAPQYGKLNKINDLLYSYMPDKNVLETDSFNLRLKLTDKQDGQEITATLILSFKQNADGADGQIWENPGYTDLQSAIADQFEKNLKPLGELDSDHAGVNDNRKNTIIKTEGQILPPSDGNYEIFIKGSGAVILYAGIDKNNLQQVANIDSELKTYSRDITSSHFTVKLTANKPFYYKIYLLNGNTKASCNIGWLDAAQTEGAPPVIDGEDISDDIAANAPIVDVPKTYVKRYNAKVKKIEQPVIDNKYAPNFTVNAALFIDKAGIKATAPAQYKGSKPDNMLDNNPSTIMHTQVGIKFPVVLTFDLGVSKNINLFQFSSRDNGTRGRIKNYTLYGGNSPINMTVLSSGTAMNAFSNNIYFDSVNIRYVKIEIADHYGNEDYIALSEVNFGNGLSEAKVIANTDSALNYGGNWRENRFGTFMNGALKETQKGNVTYTFKGTGAAIYAVYGRKYGIAEVKIDDGDWQEINLNSDTEKYNQCVYTASGLKDALHKLSIRSKNGTINIDYIAINETEPVINTGLGYWWIAIAFAIIAVIGTIIVIIILYNKRKSDKTTPHEDDDDELKNNKAKNSVTPVKNKLKFTFRNYNDLDANVSDDNTENLDNQTISRKKIKFTFRNETEKTDNEENIDIKNESAKAETRNKSKIKFTYREENNKSITDEHGHSETIQSTNAKRGELVKQSSSKNITKEIPLEDQAKEGVNYSGKIKQRLDEKIKNNTSSLYENTSLATLSDTNKTKTTTKPVSNDKSASTKTMPKKVNTDTKNTVKTSQNRLSTTENKTISNAVESAKSIKTSTNKNNVSTKANSANLKQTVKSDITTSKVDSAGKTAGVNIKSSNSADTNAKTAKATTKTNSIAKKTDTDSGIKTKTVNKQEETQKPVVKTKKPSAAATKRETK